MVKWKGYPTPTPEPQSKLLRQIKDKDLLQQMERLKTEYLEANPAEQPLPSAADVRPASTTAPQPSRIQPARTRNVPSRTVFCVYGSTDPVTSTAAAIADMKMLKGEIRKQCMAMLMLAT